MDLYDAPIYNLHQCWFSNSCDEPATRTRTVTPADEVRLCVDHAEVWDDWVAPALARLRERATENLPRRRRPPKASGE